MTTYHLQTNGQVEIYNLAILSDLQTYLGDHSANWDLYTEPLDQRPIQSSEEPQSEFKKCKFWLQDTMKTVERLTQSQARCKKNYDARLRQHAEFINVNNYVQVYLCGERNDQNKHLFKLAPVAEGLYKMTKTEDKTVMIEQTNRSLEKVLCEPVLLTMKQKLKEDM